MVVLSPNEKKMKTTTIPQKIEERGKESWENFRRKGFSNFLRRYFPFLLFKGLGFLNVNNFRIGLIHWENGKV